MACIALCDFYGLEKHDIKNALAKFTGAHRRFEFKGKINGARIFDDYGHHPTEITATANSLMNKNIMNLGLFSNLILIAELKIYLMILQMLLQILTI